MVPVKLVWCCIGSRCCHMHMSVESCGQWEYFNMRVWLVLYLQGVVTPLDLAWIRGVPTLSCYPFWITWSVHCLHSRSRVRLMHLWVSGLFQMGAASLESLWSCPEKDCHAWWPTPPPFPLRKNKCVISVYCFPNQGKCRWFLKKYKTFEINSFPPICF